MSEKYKQILIFGAIIILVLFSCYFVWISIWGPKEDKPILMAKDLEKIILQDSDLPDRIKNRGHTTNCNELIKFPADSSSLGKCLQVEFSTDDKSVVLLNAIWIYPPGDISEADNALKSMEMQLPPDESYLLRHMNQTMELIGDESYNATIKMTIPGIPILRSEQKLYSTSIYWRYQEAICRLTSLTNTNIQIQDFIFLAKKNPIQVGNDGT